MCPLLGGGHETNDPRVDMPVLAFGSGRVGLNYDQHQIDQNNSTINRLILRMKKSDNKELPDISHPHLPGDLSRIIKVTWRT